MNIDVITGRANSTNLVFINGVRLVSVNIFLHCTKLIKNNIGRDKKMAFEIFFIFKAYAPENMINDLTGQTNAHHVGFSKKNEAE